VLLDRNQRAFRFNPFAAGLHAADKGGAKEGVCKALAGLTQNYLTTRSLGLAESKDGVGEVLQNGLQSHGSIG
jgi:hypothetical protein